MVKLDITFELKSVFYEIWDTSKRWDTPNDGEFETVLTTPLPPKVLESFNRAIKSRHKTRFVPYTNIVVESSEQLTQFANAKYGICTIDMEEFTYFENQLYVHFIFDVKDMVDEENIQDVESLIYDAFNATYSTEPNVYTIYLDYELIFTEHDYKSYYFEVLDTPTQITYHVVNGYSTETLPSGNVGGE